MNDTVLQYRSDVVQRAHFNVVDQQTGCAMLGEMTCLTNFGITDYCLQLILRAGDPGSAQLPPG
jgi:hypothetical protein